MKKLIISLSIIFCSSLSAEWILFDTPSHRDKYWYNNKKIKVNDNKKLVWIKVKSGSNISQAYVKFDCEKLNHEIVSTVGTPPGEIWLFLWINITFIKCSIFTRDRSKLLISKSTEKAYE